MADYSAGAVILMVIAGGLGALARWGMDTWLKRHIPALASLTVINTLGSFLLGLLMGAAAGAGEGHDALGEFPLGPVPVSGATAVLVLGTGFLGGFTTFSTVAVGLVTDLLAPPEAADPAASPRPAARRYAVATLVAVGMLGVACAAWWLGFAQTSS
ncbi:FluC/FEX family fluoride channel [Corynebacterium urealyticum]|uniref:FluC/FEX family fluoride channel n=1 Tax=Corynebacterium urealyticum TaxID=43771 RepID=UPI0011E6C8A4|nr:CrcB family protein [Corynebacterium urealyticum]TYR16775.1 CrcB family protein [Corynebacterium urealyticum]